MSESLDRRLDEEEYPDRTTAADGVCAPADVTDDARLRERLAALDRDGVVSGYVPLLDYDALGVRTVLVRLRAREDAVSAVASDLRGPYATDVFEVTGAHNVLAVCRFPDRASFQAFLADRATDDRVLSVTASVVMRTAREYDHLGLLEG